MDLTTNLPSNHQTPPFISAGASPFMRERRNNRRLRCICYRLGLQLTWWSVVHLSILTLKSQAFCALPRLSDSSLNNGRRRYRLLLICVLPHGHVGSWVVLWKAYRIQLEN